MKKLSSFFITTAMSTLLLTSCGMKEENEQLKQTNEKLQEDLARAEAAAQTLDEVGALIDSIDVSRNLLYIDMEKGISGKTYEEKIRAIDAYMKESENRMEQMEASLAKSNAKNSAYANTIRKLRQQLDQKTQEIDDLKGQVEKFRSENKALIKTVDLQAKELSDKEIQIQKKKEELALLDNRIQELMVQAKKTEADAFFAQAEALEEAANRTKLAPKKKKATLGEALELYKKSFEAGRKDAYDKVQELSEKLD
ncbi:hypothetical protein [Flammeovirga kamogawensis]|uniref:Lipoprotein n=1 Tax=Flammeovirga kamogawensis TaxID=373891 RepID=A0ABX8GU62_9BACT|nr:hypothetical protein [Flammeovirga kamogawensis]MBB6459850.1 chromosome segregation ATPase [Flammeovirga kamogawensis]QWG07096.1 hypothetical protein KM029_17610 [Flammeovirga kamogawensis]TRX68917.1 hypothetical protein EO216_12600 [Flammeovirga kamogawensis]